ncbi:MAG TPA: WD40 repeat domain-containing protein [Gemmata sp.]|nr:WD40 repeat domain-containing protein [Gemmata sp.]
MRAAVWVGTVAVLATSGTALGQEKKPEILSRLEGHLGGITAMAFDHHSDRKLSLLATGAGNGAIRLWDTHTGKFLGTLDTQKHNGASINNLSFAANRLVLSSSSKNTIVVRDFTPPRPPPIPYPKESPEPKGQKKEGSKSFPEPPKAPGDDWFLRPNASIPVVYEDTLGPDAARLGVVTGDNQRVYYAATEGTRIVVNSHVLDPVFGTDTSDEFKNSFIPWAMDAIADRQSGLVAMYGSFKEGGKSEPAIGFVGLGDPRVIGRGTVRAPVIGRPLSLNFAPDGKWLVACNGEDVMYWKVPGSEVVTGDPKLLQVSPAYVAAAGPNSRIAIASPPEAGKKVKVTIVDISGAQPKVVIAYSTDIDRVSRLAFSPDGGLLAVADEVEGIVQLWELKK